MHICKKCEYPIEPKRKKLFLGEKETLTDFFDFIGPFVTKIEQLIMWNH